MSKVSHPPGFRPPNPTRAPQRPTPQRRASRNQGVPGSPQRVDEVEDELELEKLHEEAASLGHNGDKPDSQRENAWQQLEQFRNRSNAGVGNEQQRGRAEHSAREEASSQRLTAELQTSAQSNPSRSIFGSKSRGVEQAQATQPTQAAQSVAPQQAVSSQPSVASQKPSVNPSPRPGAPLNTHGLLATGKKVGTFVKRLDTSSLGDVELSKKLESAVKAAVKQLGAKAGIEHVALGEDKNAQPVVVVTINKNITKDELMAAVPKEFEGVNTLILVNFKNLPLKRDRSQSSTSLPRVFTG